MCPPSPPSTKLATKGIQAYGRRSQWEQALRSFNDLPSQAVQLDVVCYGAALGACRDRWLQALLLRHSVQLSLISYNVAIRVVGAHKPWPESMHFLERMRAIALPPDGHSFAAMLGRVPWKISLRTLQEIPSCSTVLMNEAISDLGRRTWHWSVQLVEELQTSRFGDTIFLNTVLTTMERADAWRSAISLLQAPHVDRIGTPNTVSFNACLSACEGVGELQQALTLLRSMDVRSIRPDVVSFSAVLSACCKRVQWETALEQLALMIDQGILPDLIACNSAIAACAEATQWERCLKMLGGARTSDHVTFNSALKGLEKAMQWERAIRVLLEMQHVGAEPSLVTYNTLMSACQKSSHWEWPLHFLASMSGLVPDVITYNTCLAACKRGSAWESALQLRGSMRTDVVSLLELLGACTEAGQMDFVPRILIDLSREVLALLGGGGEEALRPLGLAVTVSDSLVCAEMSLPGDVFRCLQRYVLKPSLAALQGFADQASESEKVLARQHSLGALLTPLAAQRSKLSQSDASWIASSRRLALAALVLAEVDMDDMAMERSASTIVAYLSHCLEPTARCRGRLAGLRQGSHVADPWLRPIWVEHSRSGHAERQALLDLIQLEQTRTGAQHGAVRMFVTHTLCISCLAACFQYKALHPKIRFTVSSMVV